MYIIEHGVRAQMYARRVVQEETIDTHKSLAEQGNVKKSYSLSKYMYTHDLAVWSRLVALEEIHISAP